MAQCEWFMTGRLAVLYWSLFWWRCHQQASWLIQACPVSGDVSMQHFLFALLFHWRANSTISCAAVKSPLWPHYLQPSLQQVPTQQNRPPLSVRLPVPSWLCLGHCFTEWGEEKWTAVVDRNPGEPWTLDVRWRAREGVKLILVNGQHTAHFELKWTWPVKQ